MTIHRFNMNLKMTFEKNLEPNCDRGDKTCCGCKIKKTHTYYKYHDDFGRIVKKKREKKKPMVPVVYYDFIRGEQNRKFDATGRMGGARMPKCCVRILSLEAAEAVAGSVGTRGGCQVCKCVNVGYVVAVS